MISDLKYLFFTNSVPGNGYCGFWWMQFWHEPGRGRVPSVKEEAWAGVSRLSEDGLVGREDEQR